MQLFSQLNETITFGLNAPFFVADNPHCDGRIVGMGLHNEILKLKQEQGKNILTSGVTIPSQLADLGLIDEYHFVVHPIVIGAGRRLFEGVNLQEKLQLVEPTVFKSGCIALRYLKQ